MTNSEKQEKQVFIVMDPDGNEVTIEDFSPYDDQPGYANDNYNGNGKPRKPAEYQEAYEDHQESDGNEGTEQDPLKIPKEYKLTQFGNVDRMIDK